MKKDQENRNHEYKNKIEMATRPNVGVNLNYVFRFKSEF